MTKDYSKLVTSEWDFGSDKNLADKLKRLVLNGKKTATTGLYKKGDEVPSIGDYSAILDTDGKHFCIIQYTNIQIKPFLDVDYEYVKLEGEDHKDVDDWREEHRKFFLREFGEFADTALVVCEEFIVVEVIK